MQPSPNPPEPTTRLFGIFGIDTGFFLEARHAPFETRNTSCMVSC